jgi:hypothetical protein
MPPIPRDEPQSAAKEQQQSHRRPNQVGRPGFRAHSLSLLKNCRTFFQDIAFVFEQTLHDTHVIAAFGDQHGCRRFFGTVLVTEHHYSTFEASPLSMPL